jgi:Alginate export
MMFGLKWTRLAVLGGAVVVGMGSLQAVAQDGPKKAEFKNLRFDEDFSYLEGGDGTYESDRSDPLKNNPDKPFTIDLGGDWRYDVGGEFRMRWELRENQAFGASRRTSDGRQLYRWLLHTDVRYRDLFRVFAQGIVAHVEEDDTPFQVGVSENIGDLQQLFLDFRFGEGSPYVLRVGRQELLFGTERFVSPFEWGNARRRFDGVRLMYEGDLWNVDAFYVKPVVIDRANGDDFNEEFDFWGLYTTYNGWENRGIDLYFFAIDNTQDTVNPNGNVGDQSIFTVGSRYWGETGAWDYELEADYQWGTWAGDDVKAWSVAFAGGYTFDQSCEPRLGFGFDWASGDKNSRDGDVETFNQMFPLGHKYFGYLDLVGRQNVVAANVNLSAWIMPEKVRATMAYHTFWLADDSDALYDSSGTATLRDGRGKSGAEVGQELDLTVDWTINRHSTLLVGYSHFWNDGFVNETVLSSDDPNFYYVQYQYKF